MRTLFTSLLISSTLFAATPAVAASTPAPTSYIVIDESDMQCHDRLAQGAAIQQRVALASQLKAWADRKVQIVHIPDGQRFAGQVNDHIALIRIACGI